MQHWVAIRRWIGIVVRSLEAIAALVLLGLRTAAEVGWMTPKPSLEFAIILAGGSLVFLDAIRGIVLSARRPVQEALKKRLHKTVRGCQLTLSKLIQLPVEDLGGSVFVVRRNKFRWGAPYLHRLTRTRFSDYPSESDVSWSKDKGAIGEAWTHNTPVYLDARPSIAAWERHRHHTRAEFEALGEEVRQKFSLKEFNSIVHKYSEVLAVPIVNESGSLIGVFSVDVTHVAGRQPNGPFLDTQVVEQVVIETASLLRDSLI